MRTTERPSYEIATKSTVALLGATDIEYSRTNQEQPRPARGSVGVRRREEGRDASSPLGTEEQVHLAVALGGEGDGGRPRYKKGYRSEFMGLKLVSRMNDTPSCQRWAVSLEGIDTRRTGERIFLEYSRNPRILRPSKNIPVSRRRGIYF